MIVDGKDLESVVLFVVMGVRKDFCLCICFGIGCLYCNIYLVIGLIFSCVYIICYR